jgi:hypothetical protein
MIRGFILLILMVTTNFYTSVGKNLVNKERIWLENIPRVFRAKLHQTDSTARSEHVNLQCCSFGLLVVLQFTGQYAATILFSTLAVNFWSQKGERDTGDKIYLVFSFFFLYVIF